MHRIGVSLGWTALGVILSCGGFLTGGGPLWAEMDSPCQGREAQTRDGSPGNEPKTKSGGPPNGTNLRLVDPETGEMVALPTPGVISQKMIESMNTSDVGLYEEPDAAGGTMVDLQGRFRPMMKIPQAPPETAQSDCSEK